MAIAYRGKSFAMNATSGTATAVAIPSATVAGDRLTAVVGSIASSPTLTDPAGWTKVAEYAPGTTLKTAVYIRDAVAGDAGVSTTWTWSASGRNFGYILAHSGVDLTATVDAQAANGTPGTPLTTPALGLNTGDWLITAGAARENPGTDNAKDWTTDDALDTERFDLYTTNTGTGAKLTAALWDSNRAPGGIVVQRTIDVTPIPAQLHGWSIRLPAPISGGGQATGGNPWTSAGCIG